MIGSPTTLTTSCQRSNNFGPSSSTNNDAATLKPVIEALSVLKKSIQKCCEIIGNKADSCIIRGPNFLPPSIRININQFNFLRGNETTDPPRY